MGCIELGWQEQAGIEQKQEGQMVETIRTPDLGVGMAVELGLFAAICDRRKVTYLKSFCHGVNLMPWCHLKG